MLCVGMMGLAGCGGSVERFYSSQLPLDTPIDWWHQLQGGVIADERPPPPGVGQPYPLVGSMPAKPVPTDAATRGALLARLASERTQLTRDAAQDPIVPGGSTAKPAPKPGAPPAVPEAPPPMARFDAATAPVTPAAAVAPAPPPAPAALQQAAAARPSRPATAQGPDQPGAPPAPIVSGPVPALPTAAPAIPALPGIPASALAPATPRARPEAVVAFLPDSAVLRPEADAALRALAARRFGGPVAVLGGGDAPSAAPDAQAAALPLAWRRARAMQAVLASAGVPASAMRVDAAALGRGGMARLVN